MRCVIRRRRQRHCLSFLMRPHLCDGFGLCTQLCLFIFEQQHGGRARGGHLRRPARSHPAGERNGTGSAPTSSPAGERAGRRAGTMKMMITGPQINSLSAIWTTYYFSPMHFTATSSVNTPLATRSAVAATWAFKSDFAQCSIPEEIFATDE